MPRDDLCCDLALFKMNWVHLNGFTWSEHWPIPAECQWEIQYATARFSEGWTRFVPHLQWYKMCISHFIHNNIFLYCHQRVLYFTIVFFSHFVVFTYCIISFQCLNIAIKNNGNSYLLCSINLQQQIICEGNMSEGIMFFMNATANLLMQNTLVKCTGKSECLEKNISPHKHTRAILVFYWNPAWCKFKFHIYDFDAV